MKNNNKAQKTIRATLSVIWVLLAMPWQMLHAADNTQAITSVAIKLPVLSVSQLPDGKSTGKIINLDLVVTNKRDNRPLLVSIAEDCPHAAGEQLRAALWMAACTVALERGDPLRGYKLELTLEGAVDGPSAGAMFTLALMSILDGRTLASDFAFTGTILPDGSVGYVGGVIYKIEAAKAAGKRRILVPAFYRTEKDETSGEIVDLKVKCKSLGLEFIPVSSVRQAYAEIYGIKAEPVASPKLELPDDVEAAFAKLYKKELKYSNALGDRLISEEVETITNSPYYYDLIISSKANAEAAYSTGNFVDAYDRISGRGAFIEAVREVRDFHSQLGSGLPITNILNNLDIEIAKKVDAAMAVLNQYLAQTPYKQWAFAAQLDEFTDETVFFNGAWVSWNNDAAAALTKMKEATDPKVVEKMGQDAVQSKAMALFFANAWLKLRTVENFATIATLFKDQETVVTDSQLAIEQLVFTAMEATFDSFVANIIKPEADRQNITMASLARNLENYDFDFKRAQDKQWISKSNRERLKTDGSLYALLKLTRAHISTIAQIAAQTAKYGDINADYSSGKLVYKNTSLLRYMLQSARDEAVTAIARCQENGVTCWGPIATLQIADSRREHEDTDKLETYRRYFSAALNAKVLMLMRHTQQKEKAGTTNAVAKIQSPLATAPAPLITSTDSGYTSTNHHGLSCWGWVVNNGATGNVIIQATFSQGTNSYTQNETVQMEPRETYYFDFTDNAHFDQADADITYKCKVWELNEYRKAAEPEGNTEAQEYLGMLYRYGWVVVKDETEAARWYRKAAEQGSAVAMNEFAWLLLTTTNERLRDSKTALVYAEKAVAKTERKDLNILDTLALALFQNGKISEAIEEEKKAIAMLPGNTRTDFRKELQDRLKQFEAARK